MSIEVRDKIGTAAVTVHWNVQDARPEVSVDVDVASEVFPPADCIQSLASACRAAADRLDEQAASMRGPANPPITDDEY